VAVKKRALSGAQEIARLRLQVAELRAIILTMRTLFSEAEKKSRPK
jgi:hypothetical protein